MITEYAIVAENLRFQYGDSLAVDGVSLQIPHGEVFGLLGPNGAGKTTFISMLTGINKPASGRILVNGMDMATHSRRVVQDIGFVPQSLALYPTLTARDNLRFFGGIYGLRGARLKSRVETVLNVVNLVDRIDDIVDTYSGGMKRRLNLAVALMHEPKMLVLDEPTVGVDPQSRNAIFESVKQLASDGTTIIYTTHYMEEAENLCQRVAIMDQGRIIALDAPAKLQGMLGEALIVASVHDVVDQALLTELAGCPAVREVKRDADEFSLVVQPLHEALTFFMQAVARNNLRLGSLRICESSLETVFLKLTGKRLRDN
jgi:ABC-2 type transport system ATP-binding protein